MTNIRHDLGGCEVVRGGVWVHDVDKFVDSSGRAGTGPCGRERLSGQPGAAVHRHTLYRINAINDSLNK